MMGFIVAVMLIAADLVLTKIEKDEKDRRRSDV